MLFIVFVVLHFCSFDQKSPSEEFKLLLFLAKNFKIFKFMLLTF